MAHRSNAKPVSRRRAFREQERAALLSRRSIEEVDDEDFNMIDEIAAAWLGDRFPDMGDAR